ncbi:putative oxidoreductase OrdL [Pseudocercospora fuligena]|uniref:Putative oxidoreductase OrdL n=1 Tax=Pseudocercospora fuligena TaxID=685502 RepID=A0A8H6RD43_9PEZI|nr:putative oxidoreductase OrdL [Pseudocercospora fuligena]
MCVARQLLSQDNGFRIAMLDARQICSGATGRNGGHVKAVPEVSYADLVPRVGRAKAREVVDFTLANVEELFAVAATLSTELQRYSEIRRVESVNLFTDEPGFSHLKAMLEDFSANNQDLAGRMRVLSKSELQESYGVENAAGGVTSQAGAAWPYRLITGILSDLLEKHGERFSIDANTPVQSIEFDGKHYVVKTPRGDMKTSRIVHATNGHAGHLLPGLRGPLWPMRGQMTAQTPHSSFGVQGSRSYSIHYRNGFDYITQSGEGGEIFVGGGLVLSEPHHELGNPVDDSNATLPVAHLAGIMDATFGRPVRSEIKAAWTGVMGFTADGLPLVGKLPKTVTIRDGDGEYVAAGYNGYGMPNAWLCGKHIANLILGKANDPPIPTAYDLSDERLQNMEVEASARQWLAIFGQHT